MGMGKGSASGFLASCLAVAVCCAAGSALANEKAAALDDEFKGRLERVRVIRAIDVPRGASIDLHVNVEYRYETTTLLGDPLLLCGARVSAPRGEVRFPHDGRTYAVPVDAANAHLVRPYHLDLVARYTRNDSSYYVACNTGIPGTEATEPLNLPSAPAWDALFCGVRGLQPWPPPGYAREMPTMLRRGWCEGAGLHRLDAKEAKALISPRPFRAASFHVASLAVSVHDLVLEARKVLLAKAQADRYLARVRAILQAAEKARPPGFADRNATAGLAGVARNGLAEAEALPRPLDRIRAARKTLAELDEYWRDVTDDNVPVLRSIQAGLARAAADDQPFLDEQRRLADAADAEYEEGMAAVRAHGSAQQDMVARAPDFRRPDPSREEKRPGLVSLALVIDVSGSMAGSKLEEAKTAAKEAVRRAASAGPSEFAIFSFSGDCSAPTVGSLPFTRDVSAAERFIDGLQAGGGTPLTPSVGMANRYVGSGKDSASAAQLVILLADGGDSCGGLDAEVETLRRQGFLFRHETIGLQISGDSAAAAQLRALARRSGGAYHDAHTTDQLTDAFENALASVRLLDLIGLFGRPDGTEGEKSAGNGSDGDGTRPGLNPDLLRQLGNW